MMDVRTYMVMRKKKKKKKHMVMILGACFTSTFYYAVSTYLYFCLISVTFA